MLQLLFALLIGLAAVPWAFSDVGMLRATGTVPCKPGLQQQPGGLFSLLLFCEDALGVYGAVVFSSKMAAPKSGGWEIYERIWQGEWGKDITSFAWSPDQKKLFISSQEYYGVGGIFELDLKKKTAEKLFPAPTVTPTGERAYQIEAIDFTDHKMTISVTESGKTTKKQIHF